MALGERQVLQPPATAKPVRRPVPWVSGFIIAACVAMSLLDRYLAVPAPGSEGQPVQIGLLYGPMVRAGQWWRILGHVFEHGGLLHLVLNMSVVFTLGFALERAIRSWRFLLVSLVTAFGSATFVLLFAFHLPTVGASGMILGWAGVMLPIATKQGRQSLMTWLIQVAIISVLPGVSWQGHLGGFLFGIPCGIALRNNARVFPYAAPVLLVLAAAASVWAALHGPLWESLPR